MSLGDQSASPAPLLYCICKREKVLTILLLPFPPTHTGVYLPVWPCSFCTISLVCKFQMYTMLSSDPDTIHWKINKTSSVRSQCQTKADQCHTEQFRAVVGNTGRPVPHRATGLLWEMQADQYHPKQQGCCGKYKLTCTTNSNMACCGKCKQISTTESNSSCRKYKQISTTQSNRSCGKYKQTSTTQSNRACCGKYKQISTTQSNRACCGKYKQTSTTQSNRALVGNICWPGPHRATGLLWEIHADQDHTEQ